MNQVKLKDGTTYNNVTLMCFCGNKVALTFTDGNTVHLDIDKVGIIKNSNDMD